MNVKRKIKETHDVRERKISALVYQLLRVDLEWIGRALLWVTRLFSRQHRIQPENEPKSEPLPPTGPFVTTRKQQRGDLLAWVPRRFDSFLIDDLTGKYGYSHISIDCGETDVPTGKAVMVESTVGQTVQNKFLDEYGARNFARIPLSRAGIDPETFCKCVQSKIGQQYDALEALTLGQIDDPVKQVCSDLAAVCLPEEVRSDIAKASRVGLLRRGSVSIHSKPKDHNLKAFISPNAFAQYFGAPPGQDLVRADQWIRPRRITSDPAPILALSLRRGLLLLALAGLGWLLLKPLVSARLTANLGSQCRG